MSSYQHDRDTFIATMAAAGMPLPTITGLLRAASALQRFAEAQCNGDYPFHVDRDRVDPAEVATCPDCDVRYLARAGRRLHDGRVCPDCAVAARVRILTPPSWRPVFNGDPRGAVLRLVPADARDEDIESGRERGVYVPA